MYNYTVPDNNDVLPMDSSYISRFLGRNLQIDDSGVDTPLPVPPWTEQVLRTLVTGRHFRSL